jgi:hypothetical protein
MTTTILRKSILTIAGLAISGGLAAGPATTALAADATPAPAAAAQTAMPAPQGPQSHIDLTGDKTANAKAIIAATKKAGLDQHAATIAIATSLQESKLDNLGDLGDANDHDSLGLFQQRPSSGWGTPQEITNPEHATTAFLDGLKQVPDWQHLPVTDAAQKVQVSAYPDAYAKWQQQATDIVNQYWNS